MKYLYKYPQCAFPYGDLVKVNGSRTREEMEYELLDTGVVRRRPLLRRLRGVRQGRHRRPPREDHGGEPWPGGLGAAPPAHALVPERLVVLDRRAGRQALAAAGRGHAGSAIGRGDAPRAWRVRAPLRGRRSAPLHRERDQQRAALPRTAERQPVREGRDQRLRGAGARGPGEPRSKRGTKVAAHYQRGRSPPAARPPCASASRRHRSRRRPVRSGVREDVRRAAGRGGRVLPRGDPALDLPRRGRGDAAGARRHALDQAVLLLRRGPVAEGAPREPPPAREQAVPEPGMVPHDEPGHHLDARQVGIPLVRGLGPGLPHAPARDRGSRLREGPDGADAPGRLPAPQRADAGLRVELQRREPAGPRLRDPLPPPHREGPARDQRTSSSSGRPSTSCSSTSPGG